MSTVPPILPPASSGKRLTVAVILLALIAAAASWWFRYETTHEAVRFWGGEGARLIRDAPLVSLQTYDAAIEAEDDNPESLPHDISKAPGLVHMRNSLLEDSNYDWSAAPPADVNWSSSLVFEESAGAEPRLVILFSPDFRWAGNGSTGGDTQPTVSCAPIADGLQKFFAEQVPDTPLEQ